jgi:hypothetical protein
VRALHRTQEQACDDLVLRRGASPREYAMQLLEVARSLAAPMFTSSQAVAMALPSTLEGRVRAIVDEHRDRRAPGHWSRISSSAAIISVIAASAFAQVKSPPPEAPAAPQVLIEAKFIEVPDDAIDLHFKICIGRPRFAENAHCGYSERTAHHDAIRPARDDRNCGRAESAGPRSQVRGNSADSPQW